MAFCSTIGFMRLPDRPDVSPSADDVSPREQGGRAVGLPERLLRLPAGHPSSDRLDVVSHPAWPDDWTSDDPYDQEAGDDPGGAARDWAQREADGGEQAEPEADDPAGGFGADAAEGRATAERMPGAGWSGDADGAMPIPGPGSGRYRPWFTAGGTPEPWFAAGPDGISGPGELGADPARPG